MANKLITIEDIETAKNLEYQLIHNFYQYSAIKFDHKFDDDQYFFTYEAGKCYFEHIQDGRPFIEKKEISYPMWTNEILHRVAFCYNAELIEFSEE